MEKAMREKKKEKMAQRIIGRRMPVKEDEPRERELQVIATKGGNQIAYLI